MRTFLLLAAFALFAQGIAVGYKFSWLERMKVCEWPLISGERNEILSLYQRGESAEAKERLQFLSLCPSTNKHSELYLGNMFYVLGDFEQAEKHATRAIALDPYDAKGFGLRADCRARMSRDLKALSDYNRAMELQSDPFFQSQRAKVLVKLGIVPQAPIPDLRAPASRRQSQ
jgi:tetratricopeptide (TPR) repeat protein